MLTWHTCGGTITVQCKNFPEKRGCMTQTMSTLAFRLAACAFAALAGSCSHAAASPCSLADLSEIGGTAENPGLADGQLTVDDLIVFVNAFSDGLGCPGHTPCNLADVTAIGGPPWGRMASLPSMTSSPSSTRSGTVVSCSPHPTWQASKLRSAGSLTGLRGSSWVRSLRAHTRSKATTFFKSLGFRSIAQHGVVALARLQMALRSTTPSTMPENLRRLALCEAKAG